MSSGAAMCLRYDVLCLNKPWTCAESKSCMHATASGYANNCQHAHGQKPLSADEYTAMLQSLLAIHAGYAFLQGFMQHSHSCIQAGFTCLLCTKTVHNTTSKHTIHQYQQPAQDQEHSTAGRIAQDARRHCTQEV